MRLGRYVNTLMLQDVLAEPGWVGVLTDEDKRGVNPLFTSTCAERWKPERWRGVVGNASGSRSPTVRGDV